MLKKIKQFIGRIQRKQAINSIRNDLMFFGFNLDEFTDKEIEITAHKMGRDLLPATTFTASEAAEALPVTTFTASEAAEAFKKITNYNIDI